ncbi:hypothetical protein JXA84_05940 [candidate division WOR-3 bacterium]|nr:hypothetical protein [candidate division WOR-3 bacterium]
MTERIYPKHRMFKTTPWQIWALGWRFVFFCYFFATASLFLGLGVSSIWLAILLPAAAFYHVLGSSLWNGKKWTRKTALAEHVIVGSSEIALVVILFLKTPHTPGWKNFSFLALKIAAVDILIRVVSFSYLIKNKNFPNLKTT